MSDISEIFEQHHGLIEVIAIAVAVITFWLTLRQQEIDRKEELNRRLNMARQLIFGEIREIQNSFNFRNRIIRTSTTEFYNISYNYDGYESVLHSGLFSYFSNNTQTTIKRLYHGVKLHNTFLGIHYQIGVSFLPKGQHPDNINRVFQTGENIARHLSELEASIRFLLGEAFTALEQEEQRIIL